MRETDAISRSAVLKVGNVRQVTEYDEAGYYTTYNAVPVIVIEALPALDVAPVVHARWIPIKLYGGVHAIKCSACNNCDNPSKVPGRYCWQCGARMDGEAE